MNTLLESPEIRDVPEISTEIPPDDTLTVEIAKTEFEFATLLAEKLPPACFTGPKTQVLSAHTARPPRVAVLSPCRSLAPTTGIRRLHGVAPCYVVPYPLKRTKQCNNLPDHTPFGQDQMSSHGGGSR